MKKNPFAGVACALVTLVSSTLQAGAPPPSPPLKPKPQFGPCYPIVVREKGVRIELAAAATGPYSVALTWSGLAGTYDVSSSGPGTPFRGSVTLAPLATLKREPTYSIDPRMKQPAAPAAPQVFQGTLTHGQALPNTQYGYTIIGTLADGRRACGQASAKTLPPPEKPARTRPIGPPPVQTVRTLTVVTTNMANAFALNGNITWDMKVDRLAEQIAASGQVPDIISMTESSGWTNCSSPASDNTGHYDMVDRLIWRLRNAFGLTYRIAYLVGAEGAFGPLDRCRYYSGDTVIYNPNRIVNLTPSDVAGKPQVAHNTNHLGMLVRRSLPICNRGARTNIPDLEQLIDGPPQTDSCNRATPSAPAWAWQEQMSDGTFGVVATLARFGLVGVADSSFDVVTTHPTSTQEERHKAPIDRFISGVTGPGYRSTRPYYPTIVLGDFNLLADSETPWPSGTMQAFRAPEDVMVVSIGTGGGALPPLHALTADFRMTLPKASPCRFVQDQAFSDHCGLIVRFSE